MPDTVRSPELWPRLKHEARLFLKHEAAIKHYLQADADYIALCHWNTNIDNGWFWRDEDDELQCGLMDWGRVRQLNLTFAIWGCLNAAPFKLWDEHLEELLQLFVEEYHEHGGPLLDTA